MQVQSQPHGTYSYQQHFSRIGTAVTLPVAACIMHWALLLVLGWVEGRDVRKLKALEAAKRSMIKELKVGSWGLGLRAKQSNMSGFQQ